MQQARHQHLPQSQHDVYRLWLLTKPLRAGETSVTVEDLPKALCEGRGALREGLELPYPAGPHWNMLLDKKSYRQQHDEVVAAEDREDSHAYDGYQRLVGSLLWCVRHVAPACAYGCSQLCKLMACPTDLAWHAALHMLQYLVQNRERGIVFSESEGEPIAYVDASNKDDPADGRTQYGYSIHWGGPLIVKSGKLSHVGINSTYNEYMALHHCVKQVVWLRQLLDEIGLANYPLARTCLCQDISSKDQEFSHKKPRRSTREQNRTPRAQGLSTSRVLVLSIFLPPRSPFALTFSGILRARFPGVTAPPPRKPRQVPRKSRPPAPPPRACPQPCRGPNTSWIALFFR